LSRVDQVREAVLGGDAANFLDRLDCTGHVRGVDQCDQARAASNSTTDVFRIDIARGIAWNVRRGHPAVLGEIP
jgi:hypothetical protein